MSIREMLFLCASIHKVQLSVLV